jgi:hypothetical protein
MKIVCINQCASPLSNRAISDLFDVGKEIIRVAAVSTAMRARPVDA